MHYEMLMQSLAATGQIAAGLGLLAQMEASGLVFHFDNSCYPMFHTLLEACHLVSETNGASQVQAAAERLSLISLVPMATALVQGSFEQYQYGVGGEGVADTQQLWLELRWQMAYKPQVQALPWIFMRRNTCEQQEGLLQLHAKKKLLAVLLSRGEAKPKYPLISMPACTVSSSGSHPSCWAAGCSCAYPILLTHSLLVVARTIIGGIVK